MKKLFSLIIAIIIFTACAKQKVDILPMGILTMKSNKEYKRMETVTDAYYIMDDLSNTGLHAIAYDTKEEIQIGEHDFYWNNFEWEYYPRLGDSNGDYMAYYSVYPWINGDIKLGSYVFEYEADGTTDLIASSAIVSRGIPKFTYNHLLSRIDFVAAVGGLNYDNPERYEVTVKNIKLHNIVDQGTYSLSQDNNTTMGNWSQQFSGETGSRVYSYSDIKAETGASITMGSTSLMLLPQAITYNTSAYVSFEYELRRWNNGGGKGSVVIDRRLVEKSLSETNLSTNIWEPGQHYIYVLNFGDGELNIEGINDSPQIVGDYKLNQWRNPYLIHFIDR